MAAITAPIALSVETVHGAAPTDHHETAHSCGNRACVNPAHLRWATRAGNQADRVKHGTDNRGRRSAQARLSEADVRAILKQRDRTPADLAKEYGVSRNHITSIQNGRTWGWINDDLMRHEMKQVEDKLEAILGILALTDHQTLSQRITKLEGELRGRHD